MKMVIQSGRWSAWALALVMGVAIGAAGCQRATPPPEGDASPATETSKRPSPAHPASPPSPPASRSTAEFQRRQQELAGVLENVLQVLQEPAPPPSSKSP